MLVQSGAINVTPSLESGQSDNFPALENLLRKPTGFIEFRPFALLDNVVFYSILCN